MVCGAYRRRDPALIHTETETIVVQEERAEVYGVEE